MADVGRRRTDRVLAPLRIRVLGNDAQGVSFAEETVTISFNQQGARISLTHSLLPDDIVLIKNLKNGIEDEFRVVGGLQEVFGNRREWGVEALNPNTEIWGVKFSAPAEGTQPKILIECAACGRAEQATVSNIEYQVLLSTGLISCHCDHCGETTRWKPSAQTVTAEPEAAGVKTVSPASERRQLRRLRLTMCMRVRNSWGVVDIAQTRDVSKTGLCSVSSQRFQVGEDVYITLPFASHQVPVETQGKIVWSAESSGKRLYGIRYGA